ncbi:myelin and lymphocyte protein-like [Triplophysa dalaica]|uniref:myelin and lymphocyte protein-like n=1 Tax=Triplophysa dalaica TaxID=1582913 RepID=UPI0024E03F43|nr:myelin and lymphocyte protein-like [Triplophysa dalaica]
MPDSSISTSSTLFHIHCTRAHRLKQMAANTGQMGYLPSGGSIFCTIPDILYLPEFLCGGVVWCLIAATHIWSENPIAYVITVSLLCFVMTFLWMIIFASGAHHNKGSWASADVAYHAFAALLYLSASVLLAKVTIDLQGGASFEPFGLYYRLDIAAVVFSFFTTLLYFIHTIFSAVRWKSF